MHGRKFCCAVVQKVLLSCGEGEAARGQARAMLQGPSMGLLAAKLCRCLEDSAQATSHSGMSTSLLPAQRAVYNASCSHKTLLYCGMRVAHCICLRDIDCMSHDVIQAMLTGAWHAGAAQLLEGAISALQSLACSPCVDLSSSLDPFPLAASLGAGQTEQRSPDGAATICRQVGTLLHPFL